jgi:DNA recombination protein RmuC
MADLWIWIGLALVGLAGGFLLGGYIARLKIQSLQSAQKERELQLGRNLDQFTEKLRESGERLQQLQLEKERMGQELVRRESEVASLREKQAEQKKEILQLQDTFTKEFENLANKILDEKSTKFTEQNQKNIRNILMPLQEKIQLVLERVLEKSGLEKDREYTVQQSFQREDGSRVLPDVIINLPNGNKMVVDSKVSLTHYERFVNADEEEQKEFLKDHINSLKRHVEQLSAKKYEDLYEMESPDFVLMFVPIETAFTIAINAEPDLYNKAFERNIVIVTPSTLLATLRTIDTMWSNEKQRRNAIEIARQAGALYDKFEGLVTDLTQVGKKMDEAKKEYGGAMNKLVEGKGNIIGRIEKLKKMGAKAKKSLPDAILRRAEETDIPSEEELDLEKP